ncbi:MAG TPA: amidohydrolase [Bacteroidales bacterium]|nr:amidohydrolase [Bacteroidales bacterium]
MQDLIITPVQADLVWEDTSANLDSFDQQLSKIALPTDLVLLPEMFNTGFAINSDLAEKPEGRTFTWMQQKARSLQCVVTGSVLTEENGKYLNRLYWVTPDGNYQTYDKRHLFRLTKEWEVFTGGNSLLTVTLKGWKIRPLICYDLRFPVWARNRYRDGNFDYDLLIYIANWPTVRSHAWQQLLMARAIENQSFVVGVNRIGTDGNNIHHTGHSAILDAEGKCLYQAPDDTPSAPNIILSPDQLLENRKRFGFYMDWDEFEVKGVE